MSSITVGKPVVFALLPWWFWLVVPVLVVGDLRRADIGTVRVMVGLLLVMPVQAIVLLALSVVLKEKWSQIVLRYTLWV